MEFTLNHQSSTSHEPTNILSFAQIWLQNNVQRLGQNQAEESESHPPLDHALYQRVLHIAEQIEQENGHYTVSANR